MLRRLGILSALALCHAYRVDLLYPEVAKSFTYESIVDGKTEIDDPTYNLDDPLKEVPCSRYEPELDVRRVTLQMRHGLRFEVQLAGPLPGSQGGPPNTTVDVWSVDLYWSRLKGSKFNASDDVYAVDSPVARGFRAIGSGRWCPSAGGIAVPGSLHTVGASRHEWEDGPDDRQMDGLNATLAVRFSYFDFTIGDMMADLFQRPPTYVVTHCVDVRIKMDMSAPRPPFCLYGDNWEFSAAAAMGLSEAEVSSMTASSLPSQTALAPSDDPDPTGSPGSGSGFGVNYLGLGLGIGAAGVLGVYLMFKWSERKKRAAQVAAAAAAGPVSHGTRRPRRPVDTELVEFPAPAYQPRAQDDGAGGLVMELGAVAGTDARGKPVGEPPNYNDLPPRYEDSIGAGPSRGSSRGASEGPSQHPPQAPSEGPSQSPPQAPARQP